MPLGMDTLFISAIVAALAAGASVVRLLGYRISPLVPRVLGILAGVLALVTLAFLVDIFLDTDLDYLIVWEHSSEDMPWEYKLSGAWAGRGGSMVLWTSFLLIAWAIEELRWLVIARRRGEPAIEPIDRGEEGESEDRRDKHHRKRRAKEEARERPAPRGEGWLTQDVARVVVMVIAVLLLQATMSMEPFQERDPAEDPFPAGGRGLNPTLQTPLMVYHPPVVFLGYALVTIAFAAALAMVLMNDRRWADISRPWTRMGWAMLTLGIGIGAMWAYETLGWGGYWAWDPVETSSLIPWIALTAFMHAQVQSERTRGYRFLVPLLGGMSMFLVLFATFVTRSGLWGGLHNYAGSESDNIIAATMGIVLFVTIVSVAFRYLRQGEEEPLLPPRRKDEGTLERLADPRVSMLATVFLLSISMLLVLLLLVFSRDSPISTAEYNARLAPFVVPLVAFLLVCMAVRWMDRRRAMLTVAAAVVLGIVVSVVNPGDLDPGIAWFGAVLGATALLVVVLGYGAVVAKHARAPRRLVARLGSFLLHAGLVLVFIGYSLSNVAVAEEEQEFTLDAAEGIGYEDLTVRLVDRSFTLDTGNVERFESWDTFRTTVVVEEDGEEVSRGTVEVTERFRFREYGTITYPVDGGSRSLDGEVVQQMVDGEHYYATFQSVVNSQVTVTVDLADPDTSLSPFPALENDEPVLQGEFMRVFDGASTVDGFLQEVDGPGGNVTILTSNGEAVIPRSNVERLYRRAHVGMVNTEVYVDSSPLSDVYVTVLEAWPLQDGTFGAYVRVKEIPGIAMLWWGMYMMAAGVLVRPLERLARGGAAKQGKKADEGNGKTKEKEDEEVDG